MHTVGYKGKRAFDLITSSVGLVVLSPLLFASMLLILVRMGRPIFFRQVRPGMNEDPFLLLKLRTMSDERTSGGEPLPDEARLTSVGRILRKTSVDELPQLVNVLKGDMSLVGPRPLLMRYLPHYRDEERRRFSVRPGITGLAQVCGRNDLGWNDRISADVEYVEHCSLALDLKILWRTFAAVGMQKGLRVNATIHTEYFDVERQRNDGVSPETRSHRRFLAEL